MRWSVFVFVVGMGCLLGLGAVAQTTDSPLGTWEAELAASGGDRATCYMTFLDDATWSGYGISTRSLGPFTIVGTWSNDDKGRVIGAATLFMPTGDLVTTLLGRVKGDKLRATVRKAAGGEFKMKAETATAPVDVSGNWTAEVRTRQSKDFQSWTLTASTNTLGWFDLAGMGVGPGGAFTVTGALVVTSNRRASGYTLTDLGVSGVVTSSFSGRFQSSSRRGTFRGRDHAGHDVVIKAAVAE